MKKRSSWRVSLKKKGLPKGIVKRVWQDNDDKSNSIVQFRGISLCALEAAFDEILQGKGHQLCVLTRDVEDVRKGTTARLVRPNVLQIPYRAKLLEVDAAAMVEPKEPKDWSIEDVCVHYVLAKTLDRKCCFIDLLDPKDVGKPYQGAFVSQARKTSFRQLLESLELHFEGKPSEEVFVWLDLFSANQPLLTGHSNDDKLDQERWQMLTNGLHDAIDRFEYRLIFFDNIVKPAPLSRAWCIWELYGIAKSEHELAIIFDRKFEDEIIDHMLNEKTTIIDVIEQMDPRKMECHSSKDLAMIRRAVESLPGSFSQIKQSITNFLINWLKVTVENRVKKSTENDSVHHKLLYVAAEFMKRLGETEVALSYFEKALKDLCSLEEDQEEDRDELRRMLILSSIADCHADFGEFEIAIEYYRQSLTLRTAVHLEPLFLAPTIRNLGSCFLELRRYDDAMKEYDDSLVLLKAMESSLETRSMIAVLTSCKGSLFNAMGKYDDALENYQRALSMIGEDRSTEMTEILVNISTVYRSLGDFSTARTHLLNALSLSKEIFGHYGPLNGDIFNNLGLIAKCQGNVQEALDYYHQAMAFKTELGGPNSRTLVSTLNNLGEIHRELKNYDLAVQYYERALLLNRFDEGHPDVLGIRFNIALVKISLQELDQALEILEQILPMYRKIQGDENIAVANIFNAMGVIYRNKADYDSALTHFQQSVTIKNAIFGDSHPEIANTLVSIGELYRMQGMDQEAIQQYQKALVIYHDFLSPHSTAIGSAHFNMHLAYEHMGDHENALNSVTLALDAFLINYGPDHPITNFAQQCLDQLARVDEN